MGGIFSSLRSFIKRSYSLIPTREKQKEDLKRLSDFPYLCTLCGRCEILCPSFIKTKDLRIALRGYMVEKGEYPDSMNHLLDTLNRVHNIIGEPENDRSMWIEALSDINGETFHKEKAEVVYFVGCVASYFPMTKRIPQAFVQILKKARVDFTLLGGEEWCCGFPLIAAGMKNSARIFINHNLERVKAKGAKMVVFSCPSCYHTWLEMTNTDIEIYHSTQFIKKLIEDGKIVFKEKKMKVTYHDPCDLGRASGVYEAPRDILRAIKGIELVEMEGNREDCRCCGGGGNLEMVRPDLSSAMAQAKIEEIKATGAEIVITSCQQCVRTILTASRRKKIPLNVMDIIEFVLKNMDK